MLELTQVRQVFQQGQPNELVAVRDVDLRLRLGQVTVLEGPSGSGKTTLLTLIGCLARPTQGRVTLQGRMLSGLPEQHLAQVRRQSGHQPGLHGREGRLALVSMQRQESSRSAVRRDIDNCRQRIADLVAGQKLPTEIALP